MISNFVIYKLFNKIFYNINKISKKKLSDEMSVNTCQKTTYATDRFHSSVTFIWELDKDLNPFKIAYLLYRFYMYEREQIYLKWSVDMN